MVLINFKRLHPNAQIPKYKTSGSAGADLHSVENIYISPGGVVSVSLGFSTSFSEDYEIQIRSRSGLALKNQIIVLNSPGTVDSDYRGCWKVILKNLGTDPFTVNVGDRIAQMIVNQIIHADFKEVSSLEDSERGIDGFGSTGVK